MKIRDYIYLVIIILLLVGTGYFTFNYFSLEKKYYVVLSERDACWNAPIIVDTTRDSIIVNGKLWLKPKELSRLEINTPKEKPIVIIEWDTIHDTIPAKYCEKYFADSYQIVSGRDTGVINYAIKVKDCDAQILFPRIRLPKETIIFTKTVDTCLMKPPAYKPINFWGIEGGLSGNNLTQFPNLEVSLWWSIKDRVRLEGGIEYNAYHNETYGRIGFAIPFNKRNR